MECLSSTEMVSFCTDPIGNASIDNSRHPQYARSSNRPIGFTDADSHATGSQSSANQGLLTENSLLGQSRQMSGSGSSLSSSDAALASLDIRSLSLVCSNRDGDSPRPLVACGLGGVQPDDNFMVKVAVEHSRQPEENVSLGQSPTSSQRMQLRPQGQNAKSAGNGHDVIKAKIVSTETTNLAPSTIPPPSFVHLPRSSSTEEDDNLDENSDDEDDNNNSDYRLKSIDPTDPTKSPNLQIPKDAENDDGDDDDHDDSESSSTTTTSSSSDDSSIDFLGRARDWQLPNNMSPEDSDEIEDAKYMQEIYEGARDYSASVGASAPSRLSGGVGDCSDESEYGDSGSEDEGDDGKDEEEKGE